MQYYCAKNKMVMVAELHCHTRRSFDAFTTERELLNACLIKGIDVVAITEHDQIAKIDDAILQKNGIQVIPGCEFTTEMGAHIIGLFVGEALAKGTNVQRILDHIVSHDGLVLIPHPFKPKTGVCVVYDDYSSILDKAQLIELYNGGHDPKDERELRAIETLATKFQLRLVATSDAHKSRQIGHYVTKITNVFQSDLKTSLLHSPLEHYVDVSEKKRHRRLKVIQKNSIYQNMVSTVPSFLKRGIKMVFYSLRIKRKIKRSTYKKIGTQYGRATK